MKKLNYQVYALKAGKAGTKDDNNLYIDGEIEGGKIKSIESVSTENESLIQKPDVDEDLIEYLEQHKEVGVEDGKLVEYQKMSWFGIRYPIYFYDNSMQVVWSGSSFPPIGNSVVAVCIKMNIGDTFQVVDQHDPEIVTTMTFKKQFKQVLNVNSNALTVSSEYYDID